MCSVTSNPAQSSADPDLRLPTSRPARKRKTINYTEEDDKVLPDYQSSPKKLKKTESSSNGDDLTVDSPKKSPKKKGKHDSNAPIEEKRLRRFRVTAPQSYLTVKERALTQRLTVLSRERGGTDEVPVEVVTIAGSTGNVYTVTIDIKPSCDCPHAKKGNQCKHIIYVLLRVMKAQEHVAYQLALLGSELRDVIKNAPPNPGVETDGKDGTEKEGEDTNRKPIEGECPICYDELEDKEVVVYCKASCGNNVHKDCMQKWMAMTRGKTTCPYCRAKWTEETGLDGKPGNVDMKGLEKNNDGYANVAGQLGLSGQRDYSTYHPFWVRQHLGYGRGGRRRGGYEYADDDDDY
ncbi:Nn.00g064400.m01.CDS01 [Neocucurbitaria sp. VM-36]